MPHNFEFSRQNLDFTINLSIFLTKKSILNPSFGTNIQSRDILLLNADFHTSTVVHFADNSIFSQLLKWGRSGGKFGT